MNKKGIALLTVMMLLFGALTIIGGFLVVERFASLMTNRSMGMVYLTHGLGVIQETAYTVPEDIKIFYPGPVEFCTIDKDSIICGDLSGERNWTFMESDNTITVTRFYKTASGLTYRSETVSDTNNEEYTFPIWFTSYYLMSPGTSPDYTPASGTEGYEYAGTGVNIAPRSDFLAPEQSYGGLVFSVFETKLLDICPAEGTTTMNISNPLSFINDSIEYPDFVIDPGNLSFPCYIPTLVTYTYIPNYMDSCVLSMPIPSNLYGKNNVLGEAALHLFNVAQEYDILLTGLLDSWKYESGLYPLCEMLLAGGADEDVCKPDERDLQTDFSASLYQYLKAVESQSECESLDIENLNQYCQYAGPGGDMEGIVNEYFIEVGFIKEERRCYVQDPPDDCYYTANDLLLLFDSNFPMGRMGAVVPKLVKKEMMPHFFTGDFTTVTDELEGPLGRITDYVFLIQKTRTSFYDTACNPDDVIHEGLEGLVNEVIEKCSSEDTAEKTIIIRFPQNPGSKAFLDYSGITDAEGNYLSTRRLAVVNDDTICQQILIDAVTLRRPDYPIYVPYVWMNEYCFNFTKELGDKAFESSGCHNLKINFILENGYESFIPYCVWQQPSINVIGFGVQNFISECKSRINIAYSNSGNVNSITLTDETLNDPSVVINEYTIQFIDSVSTIIKVLIESQS